MAAGPVGLLLNVVGVGFVAICVAETVSELVQLWTVPNAVYYYVKYFVDTEAAWVVTGLYWYSYSAVFAVQMLAAAKLVQFWDLTAIWPPFIFFLLVPILLLAMERPTTGKLLLAGQDLATISKVLLQIGRAHV